MSEQDQVLPTGVQKAELRQLHNFLGGEEHHQHSLREPERTALLRGRVGGEERARSVGYRRRTKKPVPSCSGNGHFANLLQQIGGDVDSVLEKGVGGGECC